MNLKFYQKVVKTYFSYKFKRYVPFLVSIFLTYRCNLKCKYCPLRNIRSQELGTEQILSIVNDLSKLGVCYASVTGGEPLMRKDVENIGEKLLSKNIVTGLCTNGTLITKNRAKKLVNSFDYIKVSLDGLEKNHDELRGVKGSFKKTLRGINYLFSIPERRAKIGINFLVCEQNYEDMEKLLMIFKNRVDFINFLPVMVSKNVFSDKNFVSTWKKIGLHWDIESFVRKPSFSIGKKLCDAGKLYLGIRPNGYVSACPIKDLYLGNVKDESILDIWHSKKIELLRKKEINCTGCYSPCTTKVSSFFRASPSTLLKNSVKLMRLN